MSQRTMGLVVSSLVALAAATGLVVLRARRDDTVVRVERKEQRIAVGPYAFVVGEGARTLVMLGPQGVEIASATLDLVVAGSPVPLTVLAARASKGRAVELDVELSPPGETTRGVLRFSPRKKPAGIEIAWMGPRPAAGPIGVSLSFSALDAPPLVPGASSTDATMDVPYALVLGPAGAVALGAAHVVSGGRAAVVAPGERRRAAVAVGGLFTRQRLKFELEKFKIENGYKNKFGTRVIKNQGTAAESDE